MKMAQQDRCHAKVINVGYTLVHGHGCQDIHFANSEPADGEQEASISSTLKRALVQTGSSRICGKAGLHYLWKFDKTT